MPGPVDQGQVLLRLAAAATPQAGRVIHGLSLPDLGEVGVVVGGHGVKPIRWANSWMAPAGRDSTWKGGSLRQKSQAWNGGSIWIALMGRAGRKMLLTVVFWPPIGPPTPIWPDPVSDGLFGGPS